MKSKLHLLRLSVITLLGLGAASRALAADSEEGFKSIFNGRDLTGWEGYSQFWSVKDGCITGQTTRENPARHNTFLIWKDGVTENFELRLSYKIVGGNSGIQYRSKVLNPDTYVVGGYQADFEAGKTYSGILYDEAGVAGGRGIMAARGQKVVWGEDCQKQVIGYLGDSAAIQSRIKNEDWNEYVIIADGNHLLHKINGLPTVDVTDKCESKRLKSGVLALQLHAGPPMLVQFRNIRIKNLSERASAESDLERAQGDWMPAEVTADGQKVPSELLANIKLKIKGNNFTLEHSEGAYQGSFKISGTGSPRRMDVTLDDGTEVLAICDLSDDSLKVCYAQPGSPRPTALKSEPGTENVLTIYRRK